MPPKTIALPPRANAFQYSDEDINTVLSLFANLPTGHAVALQDEPEDSENKARRRIQIMREQIEKLDTEHAANNNGTPLIDPGYRVRGHVVGQGDSHIEGEGDEAKTVYAAYMPAVALVKRSEPNTDDDAPPPTPEPDAAPDATGATGTRRRSTSS